MKKTKISEQKQSARDASDRFDALAAAALRLIGEMESKIDEMLTKPEVEVTEEAQDGDR